MRRLLRVLPVPVLAFGCTPERAVEFGYDPTEKSITELQAALSDGTVTSVQLVEAYLARIEAYDRGGPELNSIVRVHPDARGQADRLDAERDEGNVRGPLHGIPVLLKDNYDTFDMPTSGSTLALAGSIPPDDAFQVARLREAGAVILAKTNLHELAAGITSISSFGGQTRNPYAPLRNPGGSSGGTGAAVTASLGAVGWGSDTCGSIRIPSSVHNLVGLRPTKGLSSIDGIIPLSHTQDTGGPLARSVTDLAISLDATVAADENDPATAVLAGLDLPRFTDSLDEDALRGARIGALSAWLGETPGEAPVTAVVRKALEAMTELGAEVVDIEIPDLDALLQDTGMIGLDFARDFAAYLAATPGAPVSELADIVELGLHHEQMDATFTRRSSPEGRALADDPDEYQRYVDRQLALRETVVAFMDENDLDAIAYPTLRQEPEVIGAAPLGTSLIGAQVSSCFLAAHSGLPAISAPAGFTTRALPVGIELMGRPFDDARLVSFAFALERATDSRVPPRRTPPLVSGRAPAAVRFGLNGEVDEGAISTSFELDVPAGRLTYDIAIDGLEGSAIHAIVLQRRTGDAPRSIALRLSGPQRAEIAADLELTSVLLDDLLNGRLELAVYTAASPLGAGALRLDPLGVSDQQDE